MKVNLGMVGLAYDDTGGNGIPLLLIHGFPLDRTLWAVQVRGLGAVARVIAPDLRGFGESGMPEGNLTMDTYADDLRGLFDALHIQTAVIAGLSMGGYIAFDFYRKFPERVHALIFANTKAGGDSPEAKKGRDENAALAREKGTGAIAERMMPKMLTTKTAAQRAELAQAAYAMMSRQSVPAVVGALRAMRDRLDSTPMLATITVPTLVITGAEDTLIPPKESELIRDGIRGAKLISIPEAAHLSNYERPEAFNRAVTDFLKSL